MLHRVPRPSRTLRLPIVLMVLGGACELVAFALPWVKYRVQASSAQSPAQFVGTPGLSLFQAPSGVQYLGLLLLLIASLAGAVAGQPRIRSACGSAAMVSGVVCAVVANQIGARAASTVTAVNAMGLATVKAHGAAGTGVLFGTVGPVLLGFGALFAAWAASREAPAPAAATSGP